VSWTARSFANVRDTLEDRVCRGRPRERLWLLVVIVRVVTDRLLEGGDAMEGASANPPRRDLGEESLDLGEPDGARRREVDVVFRVALEPPSHSGSRVRGVVVHHEVNLLSTPLVEP
jgi:hypothetical protein